MKRALILLIFLAVLLAPVSSLANSSASGIQSVGLDPRVLEDTSNGETGQFLVLLRYQVDTSRAALRAGNWIEQGRSVFNALHQKANATQPAILHLLDTLGASYRTYYIANLIVVKGNRYVVDALVGRGDVQAIESDRPFRVPLEAPESISPSAPQGIEWNLTWVHAPDLWNLGFTGQGMVYANADTGVEWDHPALEPHYRGWDGLNVDHNFNWWDAVHEDISGNGSNPCGFSSSTPCDDYGHGTHTMGTGIGDDGGTNRIGVAPGAKWIACRNMDDGVGRPSLYIECMQFFLAPWDLNQQNPNPDLRPDAVGNSYSCPPSEQCSPHSLQVALQNLRAAGVFMAVSAGNSGSACSTISDPPGLEDAAITVGASSYQSDSIASLSSRGPVTVDGSNRRKPDLVAPGITVRSSIPGGVYTSLSGTSMSAPHVAGAVVLLWSAFPSLRHDVDGTELILEESARHLTTTQGCGGDMDTQVPNNVYGYGMLDVLAAYQDAAGTSPTATASFTPTSTSTATVTPTGTPPTSTPTSTATVTPVETTNTPTPSTTPSGTQQPPDFTLFFPWLVQNGTETR
jgi:serine protease AprX